MIRFISFLSLFAILSSTTQAARLCWKEVIGSVKTPAVYEIDLLAESIDNGLDEVIKALRSSDHSGELVRVFFREDRMVEDQTNQFAQALERSPLAALPAPSFFTFSSIFVAEYRLLITKENVASIIDLLIKFSERIGYGDIVPVSSLKSDYKKLKGPSLVEADDDVLLKGSIYFKSFEEKRKLVNAKLTELGFDFLSSKYDLNSRASFSANVAGVKEASLLEGIAEIHYSFDWDHSFIRIGRLHR